jgi:hypothetical protein
MRGISQSENNGRNALPFQVHCLLGEARSRKMLQFAYPLSTPSTPLESLGSSQRKGAPCATETLTSNDETDPLILCMLLYTFAFKSFLQIVSTSWRKWRLRASTQTQLERQHPLPPQHRHSDRESLLSCLCRLLRRRMLAATSKSLSVFEASFKEVSESPGWKGVAKLLLRAGSRRTMSHRDEP